MYPSAMRSKLMYQAMLKARESRELPSRVSRVAWADEAAAAVGIQEISISSGGRRKDLNWGLSQLRLLGEVNPFSHSSHVSGSSGYHHISENGPYERKLKTKPQLIQIVRNGKQTPFLPRGQILGGSPFLKEGIENKV